MEGQMSYLFNRLVKLYKRMDFSFKRMVTNDNESLSNRCSLSNNGNILWFRMLG